MSAVPRRIVPVLIALAAAAGLVVLFREHQRAVAREAEREAPVVAPSRVREEGNGAVVALDSAERRRVDLRLAPLGRAAEAARERLPGEVLVESERTTVLRAPVAGRLRAGQGARWPGLGDHVRAGVALAQVSDARPLALPIAGVVTRVGAQPGALVEAGQVLLEVADYSRPLVRVIWLERAGGRPPARLTLESDGAAVAGAHLIGPAAEADPVTRRPQYLYRADRSWPGGTPGTPVIALVPRSPPDTSSPELALVPDSAVLQWEGLAWAYVQRAPGRYQRVRVATDRPVPRGWLAGPPLAVGDTVVVRGAEELLSEEFRARVTVGDESGE